MDEAEKLAKEVVAAKGGVAAYLDTLGWVQARAGKLKEAKKTLTEAAGKSADGSGEIYYHLGYTCMQLKQLEEAIKALDKAQLLFSQKGTGGTPRSDQLAGAASTLLGNARAEKKRVRDERLRRLGAVGNPDTQTAAPQEGQKSGKRPKPVKKGSKAKPN
jgi:tetratricopeptide (TPR) repeat protein